MCLSDCSAMAMFRWGSLSAFQPAKGKNGMAFWERYYDFNGRLRVQFDGDLGKFTLFLAVLIAKILTKVLVWRGWIGCE